MRKPYRNCRKQSVSAMILPNTIPAPPTIAAIYKKMFLVVSNGIPNALSKPIITALSTIKISRAAPRLIIATIPIITISMALLTFCMFNHSKIKVKVSVVV